MCWRRSYGPAGSCGDGLQPVRGRSAPHRGERLRRLGPKSTRSRNRNSGRGSGVFVGWMKMRQDLTEDGRDRALPGRREEGYRSVAHDSGVSPPWNLLRRHPAAPNSALVHAQARYSLRETSAPSTQRATPHQRSFDLGIVKPQQVFLHKIAFDHAQAMGDGFERGHAIWSMLSA